jgi:hypothetical protein
MNNEIANPVCPLCGKEVVIAKGYKFDKLPYGRIIYNWIEFRCKNYFCNHISKFERLSLAESIKRFSTRPETAWEKSWNDFKNTISHEYSLIPNPIYKRVLLLMTEIEKELKV